MQTLWSYQCIQKTGPLKSLTTPEREPDQKKIKWRRMKKVTLFSRLVALASSKSTPCIIFHTISLTKEYDWKIALYWILMICKDYLSPGGATLGEGGNPNIVFSHLKRDEYTNIQCTIKGCLGTKTGSERFRIAVFVKWVFEWFHLVWQDSCKDSISLRTIWFVAVKLPQTHKQPFPAV